jgi:glycosyltransferase involved in cell wall biosynthesis
MRALVLSSVFPNSKDPLFGVFVKERIKRVASSCEVVVVAPVAWFPFNRTFRGANRSAVPSQEIQDGLIVYHPKFFSVPGVCKSLDGVFYFLSVLPLLRRLRREFSFDLIDAHFVYPDGLAACLLAKTFGCPVMITLRGTIGKLAHFVIRRKQIQWALKFATRILTVSESLRDIAVVLGCHREKIQVIPNGIDGILFQRNDQAGARRRLDLPADRTILLSVGALSLRKGHQRIIEVLPRLVASNPRLLYVVIGGGGVEGDTGPLLRRMSMESGVEAHVRLVGPLAHEKIADWMNAADVFCLATSNEGMANVLVEALACGLPVVTTRVGGNVELIADGENGLLVPPADADALLKALMRAFDTSWDRDRIAAAMTGRTWEAVAAQVIRQWDDALNDSRNKQAAANLSTAP